MAEKGWEQPEVGHSLEQATKLARDMVTRYGMSELLGPTSIHYDDNGRSLSSETRALVEQEVCHAHVSSLPFVTPAPACHTISFVTDF